MKEIPLVQKCIICTTIGFITIFLYVNTIQLDKIFYQCEEYDYLNKFQHIRNKIIYSYLCPCCYNKYFTDKEGFNELLFKIRMSLL